MGFPMFMEECGGRSPPYGFNNIFEGFPGPLRSAKPQKTTPNNKAILPSSTRPPGLHCLTGISNSPWVPAPSSYVGPMGFPMFMEECGGRSPPYGFNNIFEGFPGPCGRPSFKRIHPKKKPYCLQVSGLPVSIALRVYQNRHGFQSLRARTAPELVEGTSGRSQHRR